MNEIEDWTEANLEALIGVQESTTLEFKDSRALNKTDDGRASLLKMVSALANSAGGILVYGLREDKHVATGLDEGVDPNAMTKESIDQIISRGLTPKLQGYWIKQIWLSGERQGRVAYAIHVPQATAFAPHQHPDGKYYKRRNFTTEPMVDYEIRDAMGRGGKPELYLRFELAADGSGPSLLVLIGNHSPEPALYRHTTLGLDKRLGVQGFPHFQTRNNDLTTSDGAFTLVRFSQNATLPQHLPVYQEQEFLLATIPIVTPADGLYGLAYHVTCPGCSQRGVGGIAVEGGKLRLIVREEIDKAIAKLQ